MPIPISDRIYPGASSFASVDSVHVLGGMATVATTAARDAIPASRRRAGMLVYCADVDTFYKLGADLTTWTLFFVAGSSSTYRFSMGGDAILSAPNPRQVYTVGDSLSYNTYTGELQTLLRTINPGWNVDHRGVGGDSITMIRQRMTAGVYRGPVRGVDSLSSGDNLIRVSPYLPPLADDDLYSDYQLWLMRSGTPQPKRFILKNYGAYAATLKQRTFYARCAGTSRAILYDEVANAHEITNAGNESAVNDSWTLGSTMVQSATVGSCDGVGQYSARLTLDSATGYHGIYMTPVADSIYEVEAWVYIAAGGIPQVTISYDGTGSVDLASETQGYTTTIGAWTRIHKRIYLSGSAANIAIGFSSGTAYSGAVFYLDNVRIRRTHGLATDHNFSANDGCFLSAVDGLAAGALTTIPTGWRADKNYYVQLVSGSTDTVELLLTSGGTQDTYTGTGWAMLYAGWAGTYNFTPLGGTPDPDDATDFSLTIEPDGAEAGAVWIVWAGANNNYLHADLVKAETRRIVSLCRGGRVILLSPLQGTAATIGNRQRDWERQHTAWLLEEYGQNAIDATALLQANHNGSAADRIDIGNGVHPLSMRSDAIHLSAAGNTVIANAVFAKMVALGYV